MHEQDVGEVLINRTDFGESAGIIVCFARQILFYHFAPG
jgi:hypothetical protein